MKIIAMLSFFYEDEKYVEQDMLDFHDLGVEVVVTADGCYQNYPGDHQRMTQRQVEDLNDYSASLDMNLLLYVPSRAWEGDEVQKRQTMLDLAWAVAEEGDWFLVWDSDYKVESAPRSERIKAALSDTSLDVGSVAFTESSEDSGWHEARLFMRAQPIKMCDNHHTYELASGQRTQIIGRPVPSMAESLDLSSIRVRHGVYGRDPERRAKQTAYYEVRDREGLET